MERIKISPDFIKLSKRPSTFSIIASAVVIAAMELALGMVGGYIVLRQLHAVLVAGDPVSWGNAFAFSIGVGCIANANRPSKKS